MDMRKTAFSLLIFSLCFAVAVALCTLAAPATAHATTDEADTGGKPAEACAAAIPEACAPSDSEACAAALPEACAQLVAEAYVVAMPEACALSAPETAPEMTADIMGEGIIPADAMVALFRQSGYPYPTDVYASMGAPTIEDFVNLCIEEASAEGVRPEVLFAQIVHETGWLQFGGQVSPEQNNFGGLGATNDGAAGASFPDVRTGLRAQVQHLKAYASTDELANPVVDPRFDLISRGCAPTVYDLGGRWAYPGDHYGEALMTRMQDMYAIAYGTT
ncbi:MAG: glucosaminidase domain-containing protein [Eggerthellaceae bacterium]|nr:glucosaminidase domain-containing protein [Eggerthellaceae bacterium]